MPDHAPTLLAVPPLIANLWCEPHGFQHRERLRREALALSRSHALPLSLESWQARVHTLRQTLRERFHCGRPPGPLAIECHGEIPLAAGYTIRKLSFQSAPGIRVTANLYLPNGPGPFPAVLNVHGHWKQGKIAPRIQARGHLLARSGFVVLTVDAPGSGERCSIERLWEYHGAHAAASLLPDGDSLLAWQVRDNQRALDLLASLPEVDAGRLGVTGASGGGNQAVWLAAVDERVRAVVPVASTGSFEAYVTRRNCLCETLPNGLALAEQWMLFGAIAPRPLLILNAREDEPAFSPGPLAHTARQVREIYRMHHADERFECRLLEMPHGFYPPALQAMLGWMRHWLGGEPHSSPARLADWSDLPEQALLCHPPGQRPASSSYATNRTTLRRACPPSPGAGEPETLAVLLQWRPPQTGATWCWKTVFEDGSRVGAMLTPREITVPLFCGGDPEAPAREIRVILSPQGKRSAFVTERWQEAMAEGALPIAMDLPACGELAWVGNPMLTCAFHDEARACLWLGYPLAGEWGETIATLCATLREAIPEATIQIEADAETALAALLATALHPLPNLRVREWHCPHSLDDEKTPSLVWFIPGFRQWGDLDDLRRLAINCTKPMIWTT